MTRQAGDDEQDEEGECAALDAWGNLAGGFALQLTAEGRCTAVSASFAELVGHERSEMRGRRLAEFEAARVPVRHVRNVMTVAEFEKQLKNNTKVVEAALCLQGAGQVIRLVRCRGLAVAGRTGREGWVVGTVIETEGGERPVQSGVGVAEVPEGILTAVRRAVHQVNNLLTALECLADQPATEQRARDVREGAGLPDLGVLTGALRAEVARLALTCEPRREQLLADTRQLDQADGASGNA